MAFSESSLISQMNLTFIINRLISLFTIETSKSMIVNAIHPSSVKMTSSVFPIMSPNTIRFKERSVICSIYQYFLKVIRKKGKNRIDLQHLKIQLLLLNISLSQKKEFDIKRFNMLLFALFLYKQMLKSFAIFFLLQFKQ